jgi:hypothetical protein
MPELVRIELTRGEQALLRKPVAGKGGMQDLLRTLRRRVDNDGSISLTSSEVERIRKYAKLYGSSGGFQSRLRPILQGLTGQTRSLDRYT